MTESNGASTVSTVSATSPEIAARPDYTLDQVLQGIRRREAKERDVPLRIEYSHTANSAQEQPPQKMDCTMVIHGNNFRNEVRDAKGRKGWEYCVNRVRTEVGRRWEGFDLLLPYNEADSKDLGDRIYYHTHNVGFNAEGIIAGLVGGRELRGLDYFRDAEKGGNLRIFRTDVSGVSCVQLSAGGMVLCVAPEQDWAVVRNGDVTVRSFKSFGNRLFPAEVERVLNLHDLHGGFSTYRESCEIRTVTQIETPGPDFWKIPEPKPGTRVKVAYPRWSTKWEDEPGPTVTRQTVLDSVRAEQSFSWPPSGRDARIYETSRHWRDPAALDRALSDEGAHMEGYQAPLPFMSADGKQIVWASYELARKRLSMLDPDRQKESVEAHGMKFEAGFIPGRSDVRLGEPLNVTFYVTNTGTQTFFLETGGDSRGVRSDRFQFWAVDLDGMPAPDPYSNPSHHGGLQGAPPKVAPGEGYSEKLNLSLWVKLEHPGEYLVRARRVIQVLTKQDFSRDYAFVHPLLANFKLTVRPHEATYSRPASP